MSTAGVKNLIVDSSPLLTAPISSLRGISTNYLVTPDVVRELRDRKGRNVLDEAKLVLIPQYDQDLEQVQDSKTGFQVREPSAEAIAKITAFARKTGDIAVLSAADIRVLALCLTLEIEENGYWRVREFPGQVLTGKPPDEQSTTTEGQEKGVGADEVEKKVERQEKKETDVVESLEKLDLKDEQASDELKPAAEPVEEAPKAEDKGKGKEVQEEDPSLKNQGEEEEEDDDDEDEEEGNNDSDADSDSSGSSWITPDNLTSHKIKDLGLFAAPEKNEDGTLKAPKTVMKSAVLTGDYAMQNVALQMGLNVLGSGGKRIREVRTWVLRCHACFKLCKDPEKRFCPSCGGPTLIRTSITYVPATPANPQGYILHLKTNFQYRLRGTQYSLPNPKMGRAGGGVNAEPVLREDQKEWIRGVKSADVRRSKETRALLRSVMDDQSRKSKGLAPRSQDPFGGNVDRDWQAPMNLGEKGRKRGGKNGAGGEVRLDSSGMPVIGPGRRNVNESRRKR
ncbi:hypothetical protein T439DRAFT_304712 [Meredithblackwellia eburnea MCA 4105]